MTTTTADLPTRLAGLAEGLSPAEQMSLKLILGLAAGGLAPEFGRPRPQGDRAFGAATSALARMQPYSSRIPPNGIVYRGRPDLLVDGTLERLQQEAKSLRPSALRYDEHYLGCGAPVANALATSETLRRFVEEHAGPVDPTGVASFLYYDEPGQGIDPHIDTDVFALNVLTMLEHERPAAGGRGSTLVMFPARGEPEIVDLEPGEMVIMFAGSVAHGRNKIVEGESVSILTFGFQPRAQ
jgi:hypothetical protein